MEEGTSVVNGPAKAGTLLTSLRLQSETPSLKPSTRNPGTLTLNALKTEGGDQCSGWSARSGGTPLPVVGPVQVSPPAPHAKRLQKCLAHTKRPTPQGPP